MIKTLAERTLYKKIQTFCQLKNRKITKNGAIMEIIEQNLNEGKIFISLL